MPGCSQGHLEDPDVPKRKIADASSDPVSGQSIQVSPFSDAVFYLTNDLLVLFTFTHQPPCVIVSALSDFHAVFWISFNKMSFYCFYVFESFRYSLEQYSSEKIFQ